MGFHSRSYQMPNMGLNYLRCAYGWEYKIIDQIWVGWYEFGLNDRNIRRVQ